VLKDLGEHVREVGSFVDKRIKRLEKKAVLVKLLSHKDHVTLERMEAVMETYKSTLMIALQSQRLRSRKEDRMDLVTKLKESMEQTMRKATDYELGSLKI
jgi:hypothetical protein